MSIATTTTFTGKGVACMIEFDIPIPDELPKFAYTQPTTTVSIRIGKVEVWRGVVPWDTTGKDYSMPMNQGRVNAANAAVEAWMKDWNHGTAQPSG